MLGTPPWEVTQKALKIRQKRKTKQAEFLKKSNIFLAFLVLYF
jgi:hypothetical protein